MERPKVCPVCGQSDKIQKLSAIYTTSPAAISKRFAPPKKPVDMVSRFVFWAGYPFFAIGLAFFLICWQFKGGTFLMIMGIISMFVGLVLYINGLNMRAEAWKENDEKLKAYRIEAEKWERSYYCYRDDVIF